MKAVTNYCVTDVIFDFISFYGMGVNDELYSLATNSTMLHNVFICTIYIPPNSSWITSTNLTINNDQRLLF